MVMLLLLHVNSIVVRVLVLVLLRMWMLLVMLVWVGWPSLGLIRPCLIGRVGKVGLCSTVRASIHHPWAVFPVVVAGLSHKSAWIGQSLTSPSLCVGCGVR